MIHTIAGSGGYGFDGNADIATNTRLRVPYGIALSSSGELYIADTNNHRIRKMALNGSISTIAGNGEAGFSGDGEEATIARLSKPHRVALSKSGDLYIADTGNDRIRKISSDGKISTVAGNGQYGFSGDGGLATHAQLRYPQGIAVSESGEIYIADTENHRIRKVALNGEISTVAGNGKYGFGGDGGEAADAHLKYPCDIVINSGGELYIADAHNHRIRKVALNGLIWTIAGNGTQGFSGDGGLAIHAQLNKPEAITISESGEIYVADTENNRIRKISSDGFISTIAGNGHRGLIGDGGLATNAQIYQPCGVAVDSDGDLYVTDTSNDRIRKVVGLGVGGLVRGMALHKYERDHVLDSVVCFRPLLAELSPNFGSILSADTILMLDMNERPIIQHLIDSLMYGRKLDFDPKSCNVMDWLFVVGMIESGEFLELKKRLLFQFMSQLNAENIAVVLDKLITLKKRDIRNQLLGPMIDYTLGMAALTLKESPDFATNPIIEKHMARISRKNNLTKVVPITLDEETDSIKIGGIQSLFNDKETSDITIRLGERLLYCHRTVLSSYSTYFEALFHDNCSFNDLKEGVYQVDCTVFGEELHEMIIKFCYHLFGKSDISESVAVPLFKCASFYGINQLADYAAAIEINAENYFELVEELGHYPCEILCKRFVEFAFQNLKSLGMTEEESKSLPEQIKEKLFWKCIQEQVRK